MAGSLNSIRMIGRVEGIKIETPASSDFQDTQSPSMTRFTLVTGGKWTDRDGNERDTSEAFQVEARGGRLTDICQNHMANGSHVYLEGRVRTRRWREQDLTEHSTLIIDAAMLVPLSEQGSGFQPSSTLAVYTLNKVQIIGRLGRNPEMRFTSQGSAVTSFTVATGDRWTGRDGRERDDTEWFRVSAWDKLADVCNKYLTKGMQVYIEGRFRLDKWTDREGMSRISGEVTAATMTMLGSKGGRDSYNVQEDDSAHDDSQSYGGYQGQSAGRNQPQPIGDDMNEEDIPF